MVDFSWSFFVDAGVLRTVSPPLPSKLSRGANGAAKSGQNEITGV